MNNSLANCFLGLDLLNRRTFEDILMYLSDLSFLFHTSVSKKTWWFYIRLIFDLSYSKSTFFDFWLFASHKQSTVATFFFCFQGNSIQTLSLFFPKQLFFKNSRCLNICLDDLHMYFTLYYFLFIILVGHLLWHRLD